MPIIYVLSEQKVSYRINLAIKRTLLSVNRNIEYLKILLMRNSTFCRKNEIEEQKIMIYNNFRENADTK